MEIFAAIVTGLGVLGNIFGGRSAARDAEQQAAEEARLEGIVTEEKLRQLEKQEIAMRGATIAATAGAGVRVGEGSPLAILAEQRFEFAREKQVTKEVGASRAALALQQGRAIGKQAKYSGYTQAARGLSDMFRILGGI